jgi:hypothetical protein
MYSNEILPPLIAVFFQTSISKRACSTKSELNLLKRANSLFSRSNKTGIVVIYLSIGLSLNEFSFLH